jgi:hypothetical protein
MRIGGQFAVHLMKDGVTQTFMPGDVVPEWAATLITNPNVLAVDDVEGEPSGSSDSPPPRAGKGSGLQPWADYATANGVEFEDGAGRDEIVAACEDAGVAVG